MKYCPYCKVLNDEKLKTCKICGRTLEDKTNKIEKKIKKVKSKPRVKHKTKYKKIYKTKTENKMSLFQKFVMFFLVILCIFLASACVYMAYHIYSSENIDVPNVIGYTYEEAKNILKENKLDSLKIEKTVSSLDKVGVVIDQSKKGKAKENQTVKLYVGILDDKITVPNITGLSIDEAKKQLNSLNIKYKVIYEESDKKDGTVISQNIESGERIDKEDIVMLTVSKNKKYITTEEMEEIG